MSEHPAAEPVPTRWTAFTGGPWHGRVERIPLEAGCLPFTWCVPLHNFRPLLFLAAPDFGDPAGDDPYDDTVGHYSLTRSERDGDVVYAYSGKDRDDWGQPHDVDEFKLGALRHHDTNLAGIRPDERAERWVWVLPTKMARTLVVARTIQVIHADVPYPILGMKPTYPTRRQTAELFADLRGILDRMD